MIKIGKINEINKKYRDWFLGTFVEEEDFNTKNSKNFEVKWSVREKGLVHDFKEKVVEDDTCKTLAICAYGGFIYSFIDENEEIRDYTVRGDGAYIYFTPDVNHKVEFLEDSLVITIRWYE